MIWLSLIYKHIKCHTIYFMYKYIHIKLLYNYLYQLIKYG